MTADKSIFGLRFGANAGLQPTPEELDRFLAGPKTAGGREPQGRDLEAYQEMLDEIIAFENGLRQGSSRRDFGERIYYGVLGHSVFFNPHLKSAVEQYKYHSHVFAALDFKKPTSFITAAEREIAGLNPRKKRDAEKLSRLRAMVEDRKKTLEALNKRRADLARELRDIARYVRTNIDKVSLRCEAAIVVLVQLQIAGDEERRLVEDVKERFKEDLKDALHQGRVTKEDLESAKKDVAVLSKEIMALLREDIYAITTLYEAVHDHMQTIARGLDGLLGEIAGNKAMGFEEEGTLFMRIEQALVSLVSGYHFPIEAVETRSETSRSHLLEELRSQMLDSLMALVQKDRRARNDRRSGWERRRSRALQRREPEKRSGKERRTGRSRRRAEAAS